MKGICIVGALSSLDQTLWQRLCHTQAPNKVALISGQSPTGIAAEREIKAHHPEERPRLQSGIHMLLINGSPSQTTTQISLSACP